MPTREIAQWSVTDASNNFTPEEGGWAEGMKRSDVNNAARADLGALRRWYDAPEWLDLTVGASVVKVSSTVLRVQSGNFTGYFTVGRRVRIQEAAGGPTYATVVSSVVNGGDTDVTLKDFTGTLAKEIPSDLTGVKLHIDSAINPSSFLPDIFVRVIVPTGAAIQAAIDILEAADGGIIVLEPLEIYVVSTTILIGGGATNGNIRIIGRGAHLEAATNLNTPILDIRKPAGTAIDANVVLEEIVFDGQRAKQTAGVGLGMISIGVNTSYVWMKQCFFFDSYAHSIRVRGGCHKLWISDCAFSLMGENGIHMEDTANTIDETFFARCAFLTPSRRAGVTEGAGISFAGKCHISDCDFLNMNHGTNTEIGIHARPKLAASPSDQSGRESTITGCRFQGTGVNARGIYLQGRDNTISACSFNLSGTGTEGIFAELVGDVTERHMISGCNFIDPDRAVRLQASAEDCVVQGCTFDSCPQPYTDAGKRNLFIGNILTDGVDAVSIQSTAVRPIIANNIIDTMSSEGIVLLAGCVDAIVSHNLITNATTTHLTDGGTRTGFISAESARQLYRPMTADGTVTAIATTQVFIPNSQVISFSAEPFADGKKTWILEGVLNFNMDDTGVGSDTAANFLIKLGTTTGTPATDPDILKLGFTLKDWLTTDQNQIAFSGVEFIPASTDDIYIATHRAAGTATAYDLTMKSTAGGEKRFTYLRARPK